jgi:hypothetical protein
VLPALPRVLAAVASGGGALVLLGGAVWSAWRARRARGPGTRVLGNGLIATGTLVLGASGLLNSVLDEMTAFAVALAAGLCVLFAGFLVVTAPADPADAADPVDAADPTGPAGQGLPRSARRSSLPARP